MLTVMCKRKFRWEDDFHIDEWEFDFGSTLNWHYANVIVSKKWEKECNVSWCSVFDDVNLEYYEYDFDRECFERIG